MALVGRGKYKNKIETTKGLLIIFLIIIKTLKSHSYTLLYEQCIAMTFYIAILNNIFISKQFLNSISSFSKLASFHPNKNILNNLDCYNTH